MNEQLIIEPAEAVEIRLERLYSVLLWNDMHLFSEALHAVQTVFPHLEFIDVLTIVLVAHRHGVAVCQKGLSFEVAEYRRDGLRSFGFMATLVPSE